MKYTKLNYDMTPEIFYKSIFNYVKPEKTDSMLEYFLSDFNNEKK